MEDYKRWVVWGEAPHISLRTRKGPEHLYLFGSNALALTKVPSLIVKSHQRLPKRCNSVTDRSTLMLLAVVPIKMPSSSHLQLGWPLNSSSPSSNRFTPTHAKFSFSSLMSTCDWHVRQSMHGTCVRQCLMANLKFNAAEYATTFCLAISLASEASYHRQEASKRG